jgi:hypothetical protein
MILLREDKWILINYHIHHDDEPDIAEIRDLFHLVLWELCQGSDMLYQRYQCPVQKLNMYENLS